MDERVTDEEVKAATAGPPLHSRTSRADRLQTMTVTPVWVPRSFLTRSVLFQPSPSASHFSLPFHPEDRGENSTSGRRLQNKLPVRANKANWDGCV